MDAPEEGLKFGSLNDVFDANCELDGILTDELSAVGRVSGDGAEWLSLVNRCAAAYDEWFTA